MDMNDGRISKAQELRDLACQFRAKADETHLMKYVDLMRRSALELEHLAEQIEAGIVSGEPLAHCA
jgi:hypothetical protein